MKLTKYSLASLLFALASQSQAGKLTCFSKYFNGEDTKIELSTEFKDAYKLKNLELKVNDEEVRSASSITGKDHNGTKHKDKIAFFLKKGNSVGHGFWDDMSLTLMLPNNFTELEPGSKFKGLLNEQAADGGSYNQLLCAIEN